MRINALEELLRENLFLTCLPLSDVGDAISIAIKTVWPFLPEAPGRYIHNRRYNSFPSWIRIVRVTLAEAVYQIPKLGEDLPPLLLATYLR
jgi:hypothetical protein